VLPDSGKRQRLDIGTRSYLLGLLLTILAFNSVDRLALGLVLQSIKADLSLSDTQLGLLTGIAFALFYSVMGIPIARWADRGNRVTIIAITTALWSVAVALCGAAGSFLQLLLIRVGVAVGEAGCIPPAYSLIADNFTRAERPRAVARYMLGGPLSVVIGYFVAGWLNEFYGWRLTFALLGLPGLVLAPLAWFTLKEPRIGKPPSAPVTRTAAQALTQPTLGQACVALWANRTFRDLLFCFAVSSFFGAGIGQWLPAFFIRSYQLHTGDLGTWFAVIWGLGGVVGVSLGGEWASRHARNNERLQLKAAALMMCGVGVLSALTYLSPDHYLAFGLIGLATVGGSTVSGPLLATIQTLVPERMRAISIAILYLFANLIGMGLGPLAAGVLSDVLRPFVGEESLRYALLVLCLGYFWAAWHSWRGGNTVTRDLQAVQVDGARAARDHNGVAGASAKTCAGL
jgi:MFS family permease